jgi:hypothetical protein
MKRILALAAAGVLAGCSDKPEVTAVDSELASPVGMVKSLTTNQAELQGTTLDGLRSAGWDCQPRGPLLFISCAPPGIGLPPIPPPVGEVGRPVYHLAVFAPDGTPFGSAHFLRADLYHGQTCAFTGQPFVFRAIIGYYECSNAI